MTEAPKTKTIESLRRVLQRPHYPIEAMLVGVRRYAALPLSLRHVESKAPPLLLAFSTHPQLPDRTKALVDADLLLTLSPPRPQAPPTAARQVRAGSKERSV